MLSRQVPPTRLALVDDEEVGEAVLVELDGGAEAGEAGAHDEGPHAGGQGGRPGSGRVLVWVMPRLYKILNERQ